jgi:hypothetical protein
MSPVTVTISDALKRWGCGKSQLYLLIAANHIQAVKLGTRTLIVVESGDRFFTSLPSAMIKGEREASDLSEFAQNNDLSGQGSAR